MTLFCVLDLSEGATTFYSQVQCFGQQKERGIIPLHYQSSPTELTLSSGGWYVCRKQGESGELQWEEKCLRLDSNLDHQVIPAPWFTVWFNQHFQGSIFCFGLDNTYLKTWLNIIKISLFCSFFFLIPVTLFLISCFPFHPPLLLVVFCEQFYTWTH